MREINSAQHEETKKGQKNGMEMERNTVSTTGAYRARQVTVNATQREEPRDRPCAGMYKQLLLKAGSVREVLRT